MASSDVAHVTPFWYAAYTNAHHEKRMAEHLAGRSVEHFLPRYETVHRSTPKTLLRLTVGLHLRPKPLE